MMTDLHGPFERSQQRIPFQPLVSQKLTTVAEQGDVK